MSNYVPTKQHLREGFLLFFNLKKGATEAHRLLSEAYSEFRVCQQWFARFKSGDFDTEDKERSGPSKKFEDEELEALLDQDSCQTEEKLAKTLEVTQ